MDTTKENRKPAAQTGARKETSQRPRQQSGQTGTRRPAQQTQTRKQPLQGQGKQRPQSRQPAGKPEGTRAAQQKRPADKTRQTAAAKPAPRKTGTRRPQEELDVPNRKRAYGNSKPKKKSTLESLSDALLSVKDKRTSGAKKTTKKSQKKRQTAPTPAVIYTQPRPFNRDRLIVQLVTVTAVVLAIVLGLSVFFKVEVITVSGADVYSAYAIREASGIDEGENLLTFSRARAAGQIKATLPYVEKVRIGIKLPNTVNIMIEEADVVYAIKSDDGTWWLINSNGRVVEQSNGATAAGYTQVLGVTLYNPTPNERAVATEDAPAETAAEGETVVPVTVTGAQRLSAALQILQALEANDIVGEAASVNVSSTEEIILWYGTRYQVNLGDTSKLDYKITCMNDVVLRMSDYQSGILDISFKQWTSQVGYTPFE